MIEFPNDGLSDPEPATKLAPCNRDKASSESEKEEKAMDLNVDDTVEKNQIFLNFVYVLNSHADERLTS